MTCLKIIAVTLIMIGLLLIPFPLAGAPNREASVFARFVDSGAYTGWAALLIFAGVILLALHQGLSLCFRYKRRNRL